MSKDAEKKPFERLPNNVLPTNYKIELTPDLEKFTFLGKLEITVEVDDCIWYSRDEFYTWFCL